MRPLRLDLAGFAAFRDEATVDFTDADFFALVGPTGAGKSTVLDAICFALYGTAPRWRNTSSVVNALAPSAAEARVRLVFETAGDRYVATRVVRRDGKGRVKTAGAGLQRMPAGFDPGKLDTGLAPDDLGEVLAGTASEMDTAVTEVIGLPYDQFVTCVVLPQGQFAEFLHAKPAARQQILVSLLGLSVYERVRERAAGRASRAEAELSATDRLLTDLADVDDAALAEAEQRVTVMEQLAEQVHAAVPRLAAARSDRDQAEEALRGRDQQISALAAVAVPAEAQVLAGAAAGALAGRDTATAAVAAAEDREEKLRAELSAGPDAAALRQLLAAHQERARLATQHTALTGSVAGAQAEHEQAAAAVTQARERARQAEAALEEARAAYQRAQTTDAAAALRIHLVAGDPCPVCTHPVGTVPEVPAGSAAAEAEAAGKRTRQEADAARTLAEERDATLRGLEQALTAARTQLDGLAERVTELDERLAGVPAAPALERELATCAEAEQQLAAASTAVRAARAAQRAAQAEADAAEQRLRAGWHRFDETRDALVAAAGQRGELDTPAPPPADRDDLAGAWAALAGWAAAGAEQLRAGRDAAVAAVDAARAEVAAAEAALGSLFADAGLPAPGDDPARAATVAAERARAEQDRLRARREQADRLREQRAELAGDAQVARALAQHLRANNFEAWLLAEALDRLVAGASEILRELTAGQYDLMHDGRELSVVDHHDAGLRRAVRTLSGGETFQASLALALALSEQLSGLSTAAASLESIVLDEGFGTLDASTLDAVAATLENLAARGDRVVGVVTHVPSLAERIPVRYEVSRDARTSRVERIGV